MHETDTIVLESVRAAKGIKLSSLVTRLALEERIIDRSLQRLRRKGHIVFDRREGWKETP